MNNGLARRVVSAWENHPGTQTLTHVIRGMPLSHDIIEPQGNGDLAARAFPQITNLFDEPNVFMNA